MGRRLFHHLPLLIFVLLLFVISLLLPPSFSFLHFVIFNEVIIGLLIKRTHVIIKQPFDEINVITFSTDEEPHFAFDQNFGSCFG